MKDVLCHRDFIGSVHFSAPDDCFFGKIEGIDDLVTFEGRSVAELTSAFKEAVADYLEICKQTGKPAHKTYRGSFNIRIPPKLHKQAVRKSLLMGISLNQLVQRAIEKEIDGDAAAVTRREPT